MPSLPARPLDGHKGTFGCVVVVGGSETMIGAPALAATGALRSGAGLVKIATLPALLPFTLVIEPSATGINLDWQRNPHEAAILLNVADPSRQAVLAVGPGLGTSPQARELVCQLLNGPRALVLDADGLNLLAKSVQAGSIALPRAGSSPLILTPHPGEYHRLAEAAGMTEQEMDPPGRRRAAADLANIYGASVVVLKGHNTVVSDGQRAFVNTTGNPALATAGSGDVLTGLIAALLAQGLQAWDAAVLGVYLHGLAADLWAHVHGTSGLVARDLASHLSLAFQQLRQSSSQ
ncbi:MAG: NAD(P)H-hydrate dehydratase [Phycisphaeraceae bacterium]|nr:NAD(P)H-hydrate dehydratase [Phycisphaeraceae bacterium]